MLEQNCQIVDVRIAAAVIQVRLIFATERITNPDEQQSYHFRDITNIDDTLAVDCSGSAEVGHGRAFC